MALSGGFSPSNAFGQNGTTFDETNHFFLQNYGFEPGPAILMG